MLITPTLIWYYYICHREVWLMYHSIVPEQDNKFIEIGNLIHEFSYNRNKKEIVLEGMIIDSIKKSGDNIIICEIKKSSKFLSSAKMQLAYCLYKLKNQDIIAKGELLIPKEKKKILIDLNNELEKEIEKSIENIKSIINKVKPPLPIKNKYCSKCGYKYFCWS